VKGNRSATILAEGVGGRWRLVWRGGRDFWFSKRRNVSMGDAIENAVTKKEDNRGEERALKTFKKGRKKGDLHLIS